MIDFQDRFAVEPIAFEVLPADASPMFSRIQIGGIDTLFKKFHAASRERLHRDPFGITDANFDNWAFSLGVNFGIDCCLCVCGKGTSGSRYRVFR